MALLVRGKRIPVARFLFTTSSVLNWPATYPFAFNFPCAPASPHHRIAEIRTNLGTRGAGLRLVKFLNFDDPELSFLFWR